VRASLLLLLTATLVVGVPVLAAPPAAGETGGKLNGFSLENTVVARESIRGGGPARDRIRSVDSPEFVSPQDAPWCPPGAPVIGLALSGVAHAYPVHLMEYHQVVNDALGGTPVALSFDPLTAVPRAWKRAVDGKVLEFGVSGLLYDGQFLLYDRQTESLWAQYTGRAVAGPLAGKQLEGLQVRQEPMGIWFQRQPGTLVLARPEPQKIDYRYSPYEVYWVTEDVPFELKVRDDRYHPKEVVLGISAGGKQRAYLGSILTAEGGRIVDDFFGRRIRVAYDSESATFQWEVPDDVSVTDAYWFAWKSFHPDTEIWHDTAGGNATPSAEKAPKAE
jgi:hypothetical protein